ncbi:PREDICTED: protein shisa-6 homolog [Tinamus guttatus]|uniref:protein shisa-6 homolog n=1 Tax=Tinamus guttatus TaxID=94827 RepID=UPI00052EF54F|nr:PREDICTED: protein shisa-6 homolog [Tinamus guttatus]
MGILNELQYKCIDEATHQSSLNLSLELSTPVAPPAANTAKDGTSILIPQAAQLGGWEESESNKIRHHTPTHHTRRVPIGNARACTPAHTPHIPRRCGLSRAGTEGHRGPLARPDPARSGAERSDGGGGGGGAAAPAHETCWGYYDVSGQWDKEFECNNSLTGFRYCCGTCFYRFCCNKRAEKLNQSLCRNYKSPEWAHPTTASGALPADGSKGADGDANKYDPDKDSTNATVYISCGAIAFVLIAGVFAKVAYDKARRPPREMNIHRALADILRQQGPIPIAHCERETISAIDTSPKENTPVRTSSKNHYTPVRTSKSNPGHYGKDIYRSGGPDLHNFISSGFVTLGRGHTKGTVETIFC